MRAPVAQRANKTDFNHYLITGASMNEVKVGKNFKVTGTIVNSVAQIVAPAANVNGLYLRTCSLGLTASGEAHLFADTSAPSGTGDNTKRRIMLHTAGALSAAQMPEPMFIPAGMGIWLATAATAPQGGSAVLTWDLVA
jgi:hypothetical protein